MNDGRGRPSHQFIYLEHYIWNQALETYDDLQGLDWQWQSGDGAMTKAPLGGKATGSNPTDRGKQGTKRSLVVDALGIPLAVVPAGARWFPQEPIAPT